MAREYGNGEDIVRPKCISSVGKSFLFQVKFGLGHFLSLS